MDGVGSTENGGGGGVGKKRCRKALSGERDPLTKVRWARVTKLPLHLASEHVHIRCYGDDVLLLPPPSGPKKFPTHLPLDSSAQSVELVMRNFVGFLFKRAVVKEAKREEMTAKSSSRF